MRRSRAIIENRKFGIEIELEGLTIDRARHQLAFLEAER
jgi:hypothetical protein